jgi:hypothetical protein
MNELATEPKSDGAVGRPTRLTRLIDALRQRDWFGITIEVAVVTLGVLVAFQIDQWGDQRKQARDERHFLERLYSEYHRGLAELDDLDGDSRRVREQIRQVMVARGSRVELDRRFRREGYACGLPRFRNANFNDTAFEELIASGRLNLISDAALRSEVRDLAAAQATASKQIEYARQLMLNQLTYLDSYYRFDLEPSGRSQCHIDWAELIKDPKAVNAVVRAHRVHGFVMDERQKVRTRTKALIARLACILGKPECQR